MNQPQMATATPFGPELKISKWPVEATNRHFLELKLTGNKIYKFWHKVQNRSKQFHNPRATEEPRVGQKHGCWDSQSELKDGFVLLAGRMYHVIHKCQSETSLI